MSFIGLVRSLRPKDVVLFRFTIKTTVVGGITYYTYYEGVWSKPEKTAQLYKRVYTTVAPYVKENVPKEVVQELSQLPSTRDISSFVKTSWNKGVMTSMEFIANLPTHVTNGASSLFETMQKYIKIVAQYVEN